MNKIICVIICFLVGVLFYHILKSTCGCRVVEGSLNEGSSLNECKSVVDKCSDATTAEDCTKSYESMTGNKKKACGWGGPVLQCVECDSPACDCIGAAPSPTPPTPLPLYSIGQPGNTISLPTKFVTFHPAPMPLTIDYYPSRNYGNLGEFGSLAHMLVSKNDLISENIKPWVNTMAWTEIQSSYKYFTIIDFTDITIDDFDTNYIAADDCETHGDNTKVKIHYGVGNEQSDTPPTPSDINLTYCYIPKEFIQLKNNAGTVTIKTYYINNSNNSVFSDAYKNKFKILNTDPDPVSKFYLTTNVNDEKLIKHIENSSSEFTKITNDNIEQYTTDHDYCVSSKLGGADFYKKCYNKEEGLKTCGNDNDCACDKDKPFVAQYYDNIFKCDNGVCKASYKNVKEDKFD